HASLATPGIARTPRRPAPETGPSSATSDSRVVALTTERATAYPSRSRLPCSNRGSIFHFILRDTRTFEHIVMNDSRNDKVANHHLLPDAIIMEMRCHAQQKRHREMSGP